MNFYKLLYQFGITNNAKETFYTYVNFYDECAKENLDIISSDKNMPINVPILKDIMDMPNVKSIFKYPNLGFFSPSIVHDMRNNNNVSLEIDYSISFESNSARYLHDYINGKAVNEKSFIPTLHTILDNNYNLDPMFYMIENFAKGNDTEEFYQNLVSIKKLMTCDMAYYDTTKKIKSVYQDEEIEKIVKQEINDFSHKSNPILEVVQEQHLIMRIILLMIMVAKFKIKGTREEKLKAQFQYIIKFMSERLNTIFLRELTVALNYLEYDNKNDKTEKRYRFFNKLESQNKEDLIRYIDNMAWDFTLARQHEIFFSSKPNSDANFFIPFLFTYDKGLIEILEDFYCKNLLIFNKKNRTIPIPENELNMSKIEEYGLNEYFTEEAFNDRITNERPNLQQIYEELFDEIIKIRIK